MSATHGQINNDFTASAAAAFHQSLVLIGGHMAQEMVKVSAMLVIVLIRCGWLQSGSMGQFLIYPIVLALKRQVGGKKDVRTGAGSGMLHSK